MQLENKIPQELEKYAFRANLVDMIDFTRAEFSKAISLNPANSSLRGSGANAAIQNPFADSKFEMVKIKEICEIGRGRVISHKYIEANKGEYPVYSSQTTNKGIMGYIKTYDFEGEYITWTTDGIYAGTCFYRNGKFNCTNVCGTLKIKNTEIMQYKFMSQVLNLATPNYVVKSANPKLMNNVMAEVKIPKPPLEIQKRIISECESVESKSQNTRDLIELYKDLISAVLNKCGISQTNSSDIDFILDKITKNSQNDKTKELSALLKSLPSAPKNGWEKVALSNGDIFELTIGERVLDSELHEQGKIPVYSANVTKPFGFIDKELLEKLGDYDRDSVLWGIDGDFMIGFVPKNTPFYPTDHCGVLRVKDKSTNVRIAGFGLENEGRKFGFSRNLRASIARIKSLKISLPPLNEQEKIISCVENLESKILDLNKILNESKNKKAEILQKYLY